ncbi:MAG: hypothetical protein IKH21_01970 [Clostridia bacterium]|nr:hypothetical protein [Clostridia bacterium]
MWETIMQDFKIILTSGIIGNLKGFFEAVNEKVEWASVEVGKTPMGFNASVFNTIKNLSDTVLLPVAGLMIAFFCTYELIDMIIERNNMREFDITLLIKWGIKTIITITIVTNSWNIVMALFDAAQSITKSAAITINAETVLTQDELSALIQTLLTFEVPALLALWLETSIIKIVLLCVDVAIFILVIGRMIEIYIMTAVAPIPLATVMRKDAGPNMGRNYLRSVMALAFQAFLIMVCMAIYSALVKSTVISGTEPGELTLSILEVMGYTILLCITLFKTGNISKSIFSAH